jgi:hypothetical protein
MGAVIGAVLSWFLGFLFKRPSAEAKATGRAAKAETQLSISEHSNAQVAAASAAADRVRGDLLREPDSLRQPTKWSRD